MSTDPKGSGGTPPSAGGADEQKSKNQTDDSGSDGRRPSYESYQKLLDEKKTRDKEVAELKKRLDEIDSEKKSAEEKKLREKEDFKKLAELRDKEKSDLEQKLAETSQKYERSVKRQALLESLSGEVPKQYWSLLSLDVIEIDRETGEPDEASVREAAKLFEKQFPEVIKKRAQGGLPSDAAKGGSGKITLQQWKALPYEEKLKRMGDVQR